jgi:hypothetical protein
MGSSIQDYAKKINSKLTIFDCISLLITTVFLLCFLVYLYIEQKASNIPVSYILGKDEKVAASGAESKPFGSKSGKTYTFSWCMGNTRILEKNKVYFVNEAEAQHGGRTLSKLCTK